MTKKKKAAPKKKAAKKAVKAIQEKAVSKKTAVKKEPIVKEEIAEQTPKVKKERSSYLKRDLTKYELNGNGERLGKGKLVLALVKQYLIDKPKTGFEDLGKIFPADLHKGYKGIFQKATDVKKNDLTARYFMQPDQLLKTGDGVSIAVLREFGAGNIPPILEAAKKVGYKVKEHKES